MGPDATAQSDNPFAAPQSDDAPRPAPLEDLRGRMPGSVKLAIGTLSGVVFVLAVLVVWMLFFSGESMVAPELVLGVLALVLASVVTGLLKRSRSDWGTARAISIALAVMSLPLVVVSVGALFGAVSAYSSWRDFLEVLLMSLLWPAAAAGFLATYLALGRLSARQYFDCVCAECGSTKNTTVRFRPHRVRCRQCSAEW